MSGTTTDAFWFLQASAVCRKLPQCLFLVEPSEEAFAALTSKWAKSLGSSFELKVHAAGKASVLSTCLKTSHDDEKKLADYLTGGAIQFGALHFVCKEASQDVLIVQARAFVAKHGQMSEFGLQLGRIYTLKDVEPKLAAFIGENGAQLVASATLRVRVGSEFQVTGGSEVQLAARHEKDVEEWKKIGFLWQGQVLAYLQQRYRMPFSMSLSAPEGSVSSRELSQTSLKSEVILTKGQAIIAGELNTASHLKSLHRIPYLSALPIFGPWLRWNGKGESGATLYLWLALHEGDGIQNDFKEIPELPTQNAQHRNTL